MVQSFRLGLGEDYLARLGWFSSYSPLQRLAVFIHLRKNLNLAIPAVSVSLFKSSLSLQIVARRNY
jgi:hypothetical protein